MGRGRAGDLPSNTVLTWRYHDGSAWQTRPQHEVHALTLQAHDQRGRDDLLTPMTPGWAHRAAATLSLCVLLLPSPFPAVEVVVGLTAAPAAELSPGAPSSASSSPPLPAPSSCAVPHNGASRLANGFGLVLNDVTTGVSAAVATLLLPTAAYGEPGTPLAHLLGTPLKVLVEVTDIDPVCEKVQPPAPLAPNPSLFRRPRHSRPPALLARPPPPPPPRPSAPAPFSLVLTPPHRSSAPLQIVSAGLCVCLADVTRSTSATVCTDKLTDNTPDGRGWRHWFELEVGKQGLWFVHAYVVGRFSGYPIGATSERYIAVGPERVKGGAGGEGEGEGEGEGGGEGRGGGGEGAHGGAGTAGGGDKTAHGATSGRAAPDDAAPDTASLGPTPGTTPSGAITVDALVFSKDRPYQLHGLLTSLRRHATRLHRAVVVYHASTPCTAAAYAQLAREFPSDTSSGNGATDSATFFPTAFLDDGARGFRNTVLEVSVISNPRSTSERK